MTQPTHVAQLNTAASSYAQAPQSSAQRTWSTIR